jgi:hypothetical protein
MLGSSRVAAQFAASHEGLSSVSTVNFSPPSSLSFAFFYYFSFLTFRILLQSLYLYIPLSFLSPQPILPMMQDSQYFPCTLTMQSQARSFSITTMLQTGWPRSRCSIPGRDKWFSPSCPDWLWCPPNLLYNGYGWLFGGEGKQQGHYEDHSPLSSVEVKNSEGPPLLHTSSWYGALIKAQGQLDP